MKLPMQETARDSSSVERLTSDRRVGSSTLLVVQVPKIQNRSISGSIKLVVRCSQNKQLRRLPPENVTNVICQIHTFPVRTHTYVIPD